jgi:uncharacterized protein YqeY
MELNIYQSLNNKLKEAMKNKDEDVKNYIRSIKSKLSEYQVANGMNRNDTPDDDVLVTVIKSHTKSLEKAITQFAKGGGSPLIEEYNKEITFCSQYIPSSKNSVDLGPIIDDAVICVGSNVGKVMGYIMKNNKGLDGAEVKKAVMERLK